MANDVARTETGTKTTALRRGRRIPRAILPSPRLHAARAQIHTSHFSAHPSPCGPPAISPHADLEPPSSPRYSLHFHQSLHDTYPILSSYPPLTPPIPRRVSPDYSCPTRRSRCTPAAPSHHRRCSPRTPPTPAAHGPPSTFTSIPPNLSHGLHLCGFSNSYLNLSTMLHHS